MENNALDPETEAMERFILNEMNAEEAGRFRQRMALDARLQRQVAELQLLLLGIQEAALKEQLPLFHNSLQPGREKTGSPGRVVVLKSLVAAAAFILVAALAAWLYLRGGKEARLFEQYFQPDPGLMTAMGGSNQYAFDRAMVAYKTGDYARAIREWEGLLQAKPASDTLSYFLGAAHLAGGDAGKAIPYFRKVIARPGALREDAHWYLALAYLKQGRRNEARVSLQQATHENKMALLQQLR